MEAISTRFLLALGRFGHKASESSSCVLPTGTPLLLRVASHFFPRVHVFHPPVYFLWSVLFWPPGRRLDRWSDFFCRETPFPSSSLSDFRCFFDSPQRRAEAVTLCPVPSSFRRSPSHPPSLSRIRAAIPSCFFGLLSGPLILLKGHMDVLLWFSLERLHRLCRGSDFRPISLSAVAVLLGFRSGQGSAIMKMLAP